MIRKSSESNSRLCHRQPAIRGSTVLSCNTLLHQQLLLASEVDLDALQRSITSQDYSQTSTISNALIVTAALAWFVYDLRPRGSCREDLIDVQKSNVIRNQLGVVARKFVPKGTVVGSYPGYRKSLRRFAAGKEDEEAQSRAKRFLWKIDDDTVIDPTGSKGNLLSELSFLGGAIKVSTTLARINEPPKGMDVNVYVKVENGEVIFIAERDIFADEELFVDYGTSYFRDDYEVDDGAKQRILVEKMAKDREMDEKLEPILGNSPSSSLVGEKNEKEARYRQRGILSPRDAEKMFKERGTGMFADPEDQELIDSLLGKDLSSKLAAESSDGNLRDQLVQDTPRSQPGKSKSIFDTREKSSPDSVSRDSTPMSELEEKLESMTEEQLVKVAEKLKMSMNRKFLEEYRVGLQKRREMDGKPQLPKISPVDGTIREKYSTEFKEFESVLENMYSDPLATLQEMLQNPDVYFPGENEVSNDANNPLTSKSNAEESL